MMQTSCQICKKMARFAFLLVLGTLTSSAADKSPSINVRADAYVSGSWNGILMIVDDEAGFQVRIGSRVEGSNYLDGDTINPFLTGLEDLFDESAKKKRESHPSRRLAHFYESVTEVGPHAGDGSYCRLAWNPLFPYDTGSRLRLEWSRLDAHTVLGKLTYIAPINYMSDARNADIVLEAYSPIDFEATYAAANGTVTGRETYTPVLWETQWNGWKFRFSSDDLKERNDAEPGYRQGLWKAGFNDAAWTTVRWGSYWQEDPFLDKRGYGWYRARVEIPAELKGKTLRLDLGKVREDDWTYLNGDLVGQTHGKDVERAYILAPGSNAYEKIRWGAENDIAVQVYSGSELGGIASGPYGHTPALIAVRLQPSPHPRLEALAQTPKTVNFVLVSNRNADQEAAFKDIKDLQNVMQEKWQLGASTGDRAAGLLYYNLHTENIKAAQDNVVFFVAKVGEESPEELLSAARALVGRADLDSLLQTREAAYEARRVKTTGGLQGVSDMITNSLHWAVLYGREQKRAFVVDSRRWFLPDSWTLFGNSAVLTAWAAAAEDKKLAEDTLKGILVEALPDGRVMNAAGKVITTPDRSEDMYASYVAWKIYEKWGDKEYLREIYPYLKNWHEWWFADRGDGQPWRDGNRDGLLELGSNMSSPSTPQSPPESEDYGTHFQGAMWESGYDDSPMWGYYAKGPSVHPARFRGEESVEYVYRSGTLNLNTTLTNALWALSADMLVRIAHELGYSADEARFHGEYERIKKRINEVLWDETTGMYLNRFWPEAGGKFSYRKSPTMFYMMAAGVPSPAQAERLVREHLLNPKEFWGEYVLPSISRDDPAYPEQYYWRGTIWPPMNYFTYEGLKRYGYDDVAAQLAEKTYHLMKKNWDSTGAIWENYNSITGEGDSHGAGGSTRHYSWSGAMAMIPIMEVIDSEAWSDGLRFGSLGLKSEARVANWKIRNTAYAVTAGPHLTTLERNGQKIFSASAGIVVRHFAEDPAHVTFRYKTDARAEGFICTLGGLEAGNTVVTITLDGHPFTSGARSGPELTMTLPAGEHSVEVRTSAP